MALIFIVSGGQGYEDVHCIKITFGLPYFATSHRASEPLKDMRHTSRNYDWFG